MKLTTTTQVSVDGVMHGAPTYFRFEVVKG